MMIPRSSSPRALYEPHGEIRTRLWLLVPLRLYAGAYFALSALQKAAAGFLSDSRKLAEFLQPTIEAASYPYGLYRAFYHAAILPHADLFCFLVVFGELLTGLALLTGTLTRFASLVGLFLVGNFAVATNVDFLQPHNTTAFAAILVVLLATGAGRAYGLDHYLRGRVPSWLA